MTIITAAEAIREGTAVFKPGKPDVYGDAQPKELLRLIGEDHDVLRGLANTHIVSATQFDRPTLLQLFRLAAKFEANPKRFSTPLQGKILISAFYEPSTRTRLSFESAWHRMGGDIMSITDLDTTGIAKGESLSDVAEMFNNYGDCVVLRDNHENGVIEMLRTSRIPVINAGNGTDEHPTQALADLYAMLKWSPKRLMGKARGIHVGIVGVPRRMRTVRSLLTMLGPFAPAFAKVTIVHDGHSDPVFAPGQREALEAAGLTLEETTQLNTVLPALDVVYINSIAWVKNAAEVMGEGLTLSDQSPLKKDAIVLHPLARGPELDPSLDATPHNWYFAQARGAVFVRMALLTCMVQRTDHVVDVA